VFGAIALAAFLLTGQYMDKVHDHLSGMPDGPRMIYRTRHIFILFTGLLNLVIGVYAKPAPVVWRRAGQLLGSGLIVLAAGLFLAGFIYEPGLSNLRTPFSHWGVYAAVAGVLLHVISGV
jgi:hypothetical protein